MTDNTGCNHEAALYMSIHNELFATAFNVNAKPLLCHLFLQQGTRFLLQVETVPNV